MHKIVEFNHGFSIKVRPSIHGGYYSDNDDDDDGGYGNTTYETRNNRGRIDTITYRTARDHSRVTAA